MLLIFREFEKIVRFGNFFKFFTGVLATLPIYQFVFGVKGFAPDAIQTFIIFLVNIFEATLPQFLARFKMRRRGSFLKDVKIDV